MKIKITHNLTSQKNYLSQRNIILIYFLTDIWRGGINLTISIMQKLEYYKTV